jgi:hypothetical protein
MWDVCDNMWCISIGVKGLLFALLDFGDYIVCFQFDLDWVGDRVRLSCFNAM